jgi:hypothetical protein
MFERVHPEIVGNKYLVIGTVDRQIWKRVKEEKISSNQISDHVHDFKNVWKFEIFEGWVPAK